MIHLFDRLDESKNIIMREKEDCFEVVIRGRSSAIYSFDKGNTPLSARAAQKAATFKYVSIYNSYR